MLTEQQIQNALIVTLQKQGYHYAGHRIFNEDINKIFKTEIERLNQTTFTETEFNRILTTMNVDMAKAFILLRYGVTLTRDNNTTTIVKLFDTNDYTNNTLKVVDEVTIRGFRTRRLDVVILLNGIPVIAMELKKPGNKLGLAEALKDINVYTKEGVYRDGLLKFVQLYIHSDEVNTRYQAANPATENGGAYSNGFAWADEVNTRINRLLPANGNPGFADTFLQPNMVQDILWKYMLHIPSPANTILVLRPYQIYAVHEGTKRLLTTSDNGFFWHATGSGKTLTSFILTKTIAEEQKFEKVIMLLDRNDLADQTIQEYNKFTGRNFLTIARSTELKQALLDPTKPTIITTIQSFNKLIENNHRELKRTFNQQTCFIIDECHRSTFGKMYRNIRKKYQHSQFIGFTGTPILPENPNQNDLVTRSIFGDPIHTYTIKNAIDDGNVLPFELKEVQIGADDTTKNIRKNKTYYAMSSRLAEISNYIIEHFYKHTEQKYKNKNPDHLVYYTGMLAAGSIQDAYHYWKAITPELEKQNRTTAIIFSIQGKEEDKGEGTTYDYYTHILTEYDKTYGTNFTAIIEQAGVAEARKKHLADIMKRVKNREIDLIIVSDMLLTGFDAQTLNTIYIDKNLEYHNLIQAMSRTNRTHPQSQKQTGNVVLFSDREMQTKVDDAILLYSNSNSVEGVVRRQNYTELYNIIITQTQKLTNAYPTPDHIDKIQEITDLLDVAKLYSELNNNLKRIQTYDEWENTDWNKIGITQDDLAYYSNAIINKRDFLETSRPTDVDEDVWKELNFSIDSIRTATINVAYINELFRNAIYAPEKEKNKWFKQVERALELSNDPEVLKRKEALKRTIAQKNHIKTEDDFHRIYTQEQNIIYQNNFIQLAEQFNFTNEKLNSFLRFYRNLGVFPEEDVNNALKEQGYTSMRERREIKNQLKTDLNKLLGLQ